MMEDLGREKHKTPATELRALIHRYRPSVRRRLRSFAAAHPRHADLLRSFPAACYAIATGRGPASARAEAAQLARRGRPLATIAETLDLPPWLRRFEPEALPRPIPSRLTFADPIPGFNDRLARRAPSALAHAGAWLERLFDAIELGPPEFALWACDDPDLIRLQGGCPRMLAVHAHFSLHGAAEAAALIGRPWTPHDSWPLAKLNARDWYMRALFDIALRLDDMPEPSVKPSRYKSFQITPLLSPLTIRQEGKEMRHCIANYWPLVLSGCSMLFRIEAADGERANFEVRRTYRPARLRIREMKGVANREPSATLLAGAAAWVSDVLAKAGPNAFPLRLAIDQPWWELLWSPYWDEYGADVGPPVRPTHSELVSLVAEFDEMTLAWGA